MAAANYITLSELRDELQLVDTTQDTRLNRAIVDASRAVDAFCRQLPGAFAPQTLTKTFDSPQGGEAWWLSPLPLVMLNQRGFSFSGPKLEVPPLRTITSLLTDHDGDGVFEVTWSAATDYLLYPQNVEIKRQIAINMVTGRYGWPGGQARIRIAGSWGITEDGLTPYPIRRSTVLLAQRYFKRTSDLTGNPLSPNASPSKMVLPLDEDVKALLGSWAGQYREQWVGV